MELQIARQELGEIERSQIHDHPLTLCEDDSRCPNCGCLYYYLFDCKICGFNSEKCFSCDGEFTNSDRVYFCKMCGTESPLFHKSCAEFSEQMKLASLPHCSFNFIKQVPIASLDKYSLPRTKEFNCDFCNESKDGDKWGCDLCNFQICTRCTDTLIEYHQGGGQIQHFTHHHPLAPLRMVEGVSMNCQMCRKNMSGQVYGCAPCQFIIHKSCGELLQALLHPFHPSHSLTLQQDASLKSYFCDACCSFVEYGMCYRCDNCNFDLHPECLSLKPNIKYQGHPHLLILVERTYYKSICSSCRFDIEGTFFLRCVKCSFNFHVQCGPAVDSLPPTVLDETHVHPRLFLSAETMVEDDSVLLECHICKKQINPDDPSYFCSECDEYHAHVGCAITEIQFDGRERRSHFSHDHLLVLLESDRNGHLECDACKKLIFQGHPAYGCEPCRFYIHKSCFEMPVVIHHNAHQHCLTLMSSFYSVNRVCNACGKYLNGIIYRCERCDFDLHLDCASRGDICRYQNEDEDGEGVGDYSHCHPLTRLDHGETDLECNSCFKNIYNSTFRCVPCELFIRKPSAELMQEIRHTFHPSHSLTLRENTSSVKYGCDACCFDIAGMHYRCDDCDFNLHVECSFLKPNIMSEYHQHLVIPVVNRSYKSLCQACNLMIEDTVILRCVECCFDIHARCTPAYQLPAIVHQHYDHLTFTTEKNVRDGFGSLYCNVCEDEKEKLKHFSHDHLVFHVGIKWSDCIVCFACKELIQAQNPAFGCDPCSYYLHRSCIDLPRKIQHFFHRHPLTLMSHPNQATKYQECCACNKNLQGFFYQCDSCFVLDLDCASKQHQIRFEGDGGRFLALFRKSRHMPECREYISATSGALDQNCVKCNFRVYVMRSPMPQTLQCTSHHHLLTLMDSVYDGNYDLHVCDICEEERDPGLCVYYCAECDFIAEFDCVISEVILAQHNKAPDVQLRKISRKIPGSTVSSKRLTCRKLQYALTGEEKETWRELKKGFIEEKEEIYKKFLGVGDEAKASTSEKFVYSDNDFLQHLSACSGVDKVSLLNSDDYESEVLDVEGYKTVPKLAGVLKNLLDKYGDVGATSTLPSGHSNLKTWIMVKLCSTVHSMCSTMIQDVSYGFLYTWWRHFSLARRAGFKVDFLFDHMKRIARDRYRIDNELHQNMINHIGDNYEEMAKRSKEIAELALQISRRKATLDELRRQTQERISNIPYQRLRLETEQLSEAREVGLMKAGKRTGLL